MAGLKNIGDLRIVSVTIVPDTRPERSREEVAAQKAAIRAHLECASGGYTQQELDAGFELVRPEDHWKAPIDAVIPAEARDLVERAVPWYSGGHATFRAMPDGRLRVTAPGYWASIGS